MKDVDDKTGSNKAGSVDKKAAEPVKKVPETPAEVLAGLCSLARELPTRVLQLNDCISSSICYDDQTCRSVV